MTYQVWKFPLPQDDVTLDMPLLATPLSVHLQHGVPTIWARVDPTLPLEKRRFVLVGTGIDIPPDPRRFLGTILMHSDSYVVHVFEIAP